MELSLAPSTARSRRSTIRAFARYCIFFKHQFCPTNAQTLNEYAAWLANNEVKASSISTYISAIRSFHLLRGFEDPVSTKVQTYALRATLKGAAISPYLKARHHC